MKKKVLEGVKEEIIKCKNEYDHLWKQTSDWQSDSIIKYGDGFGHPENRIGVKVKWESATFECQNCGTTKVFKR